MARLRFDADRSPGSRSDSSWRSGGVSRAGGSAGASHAVTVLAESQPSRGATTWMRSLPSSSVVSLSLATTTPASKIATRALCSDMVRRTWAPARPLTT